MIATPRTTTQVFGTLPQCIEVRKDGSYDLNVYYANRIAGLSNTNVLTVNGSSQGSVILPPTGGWLGDPHDPREFKRMATVPISLNAGQNLVRIQKVDGYAEMAFVSITLP